jgi:hypothetical protein
MLQEEYEELRKRYEEEVLGTAFEGERIFLCDGRKCNERNDIGVYNESI